VCDFVLHLLAHVPQYHLVRKALRDDALQEPSLVVVLAIKWRIHRVIRREAIGGLLMLLWLIAAATRHPRLPSWTTCSCARPAAMKVAARSNVGGGASMVVEAIVESHRIAPTYAVFV